MGKFKTIWEQCSEDAPAFHEANQRLPQLVGDLATLKAHAIEAREPLDAFGLHLANLMDGVFELADNKSDESIARHIELLRLYPDHPYTLDKRCDYTRGLLLLDGPGEVQRARQILREITDEGQHSTPLGSIARVEDRYYIPLNSGFAGIFLTTRMPNGHLCEIQVHDRTYWKMAQETHTVYKAYQSERISMSPEEWRTRSEEFLSARKDELLNILITSGMADIHAIKDPEGDCSWPGRIICDIDNNSAYYFVARHEIA